MLGEKRLCLTRLQRPSFTPPSKMPLGSLIGDMSLSIDVGPVGTSSPRRFAQCNSLDEAQAAASLELPPLENERSGQEAASSRNLPLPFPVPLLSTFSREAVVTVFVQGCATPTAQSAEVRRLPSRRLGHASTSWPEPQLMKLVSPLELSNGRSFALRVFVWNPPAQRRAGP